MAYRLDIKRILSMNFFHDLPQIMLGCALAAIATDLFLIPNGLAAGGVTGLATIIQAVGASRGLSLPVGIQTIVMNALLLLVVMREGGMFYVVQTATGFVLLGFFTDLFAPFVAPLAHGRSDAARYVGRHHHGHRLWHGAARRAPTPAARTRLAKSSRVIPRCPWARPSWRSMLPYVRCRLRSFQSKMHYMQAFRWSLAAT